MNYPGSSTDTYRDSISRLCSAWDRFWFTPRRPHLLCVLRILTGAMLLYCHLVLASDLLSFLGDKAWINNEMARQLHDGAFGFSDWARSYLWHVDSPALIKLHHAFTIVVTLCFMIGLGTRLTAPLAVFLQLMLVHRLTGALFGLDQIVTYTSLYLALTPCGSRFSVDAWLAKRFADRCERSAVWRFMLPDDSPSVMANVGTRLLQLHLCVIYLFGGLSKARGATWWDGTAVWLAVANYEYQSWDMTWMSRYPAMISALSNATLFWEVFYCALVWPRITRPVVIAVAVAVHLSIALFLGMGTFGLMMVFANGIFLPPEWFQSKEQRLADQELAAERLDDPDDEGWADSLIDEITAAEAPGGRELSAEEKEQLREKKRKIQQASARVKRRYRALKKREEKYEERVRKLREREGKIKDFVKKRKDRRKDSGDSGLDV